MKGTLEKVCRRCGALNDESNSICMRCGETLELTEEKRNELFKDKMLSEKLFVFLFAILFTAYLFGIILYGGPWIHDKLLWLGKTYIFKFYEDLSIIYIGLEVLYTLSLFLLNYIALAIILYSIIGSKIIKKSKLNGTCTFIFIYMILSSIIMTICTHRFDYVIIIEHFMSVIVFFPFIKEKILKRSI